MASTEDVTAATAFVASYLDKDWQAVAQQMHPEVTLRGMLPRAIQEAHGVDRAVRTMRFWLEDDDHVVEVIALDAEPLPAAVSVTWRFTADVDGDPQRYLVHQHAIATIVDGTVRKFDMLCAGSRPVGSAR